jgi:serine/threonine protein kinase
MRQLEWGMHQNGSYLLNKAISKIHRVPASKQALERETSAGYVAQTDAAPAKGASPLNGQQIGHYTLIRQLGQGGYASVFLGEHHYLNTYVALKLLNLYLASEEDTKHFQLEARILAYLRHKNIVRLLDFGVERGTPFLVMEYASKGNLQQFLPHEGALPVGIILPFVTQMASALQYVHNHGLIHCDVKPENMLLGPLNELWLSDFGIAITATAVSNKQFNTRELKGSVNYIAPEHINGNPMPASDQYALAVMVYQWLCGRFLFQGTDMQVCLQHLSTPPIPLRDHVPSTPRAVEHVVLKALAKDPYQRFAHVQEFASALKQANRHR